MPRRAYNEIDRARVFANKISYNSSSDCWKWAGYIDRGGYGRFSVEGISTLAHRFSWILCNGPIPKDLLVLHRCDNRKCVNPVHLYLGDESDNHGDMIGRKRHSTVKCRFTQAEVDYIRELLASGNSQKQIAERFDVSMTTISKIKNNLSFPVKSNH